MARGRRGKCRRKEGLIEDDKELDTESQLVEGGGGSGPSEGSFREDSETEGEMGREKREEERRRRNKGGYD